MNIRELVYFITVIDAGNFTDAADICCVTQPTLSAGIKKLEDELDTQLIIRGTKHTGGIRPTVAGIKIAEIARAIQGQANKIKKIARDTKNPFIGDLRIGAFPTLCPYLMPEILPIFKSYLPDMRFFILEEKSDILIKMLEDNAVDIVFLASPHTDVIPENQHQHFVTHSMFFDPFYLAVPKHHAFEKMTPIPTNDIIPNALLLLEEGHCLRTQALSFCQTPSKNQIDFRGSSLETLLSMVRMGTGYTFVPKIAMNAIHTGHDDITFIPLQDTDIGRTIYMIFNMKTLATDVVEKCIDFSRLYDYDIRTKL
ncbi:MAG: LysR family hydrogen peroxide-inducible transcriptional activator [Alphaproteobacteria bacterium]|jgi:LysR family hydrogen peroxide-inducible transcriptional activator